MEIKEYLHKKVKTRYAFFTMVFCFLIFIFPTILLYNSNIDIRFLWCWGSASAFIGGGIVIWIFRDEFDEW